MKISEFANNEDLDEVAHNEPSHLDLHSLSSNLRMLNMIKLGPNNFLKICRQKFCHLLFGSERVKTIFTV